LSEKKGVKTSTVVGILVLLAVALSLVYLLSPETRVVAKQVPYQVPVYETRYSGTLYDYGLTTYKWTFKDAKSFTYEYTGRDFWGNPEYTVTIDGTRYPEINYWEVETYQVLVGYETKYRTEYEEVTKTRIEWILSGQ
jgi:hypothetical protein